MKYFLGRNAADDSQCLYPGGIPGDHLIVPVSGHSVPSPMHLRLGQKEKVWTGEYVEEEEEEDGIVRIKAMGDEEEDNNLDGEDELEFEGKGWENEEEEEEDEEEEDEEDEEEENDEEEEPENDGDQAPLEWEIPDFPSQSSELPHSHLHHHGLQQKAQDGDDVAGAAAAASQAEGGDVFRPPLSRYRVQRRPRRWQRLRTHRGLGFRLTRHWKSWRQRAQWVCSQGLRYRQRAHHLYGKQRRTKRYQKSPYSDGEEDSNDEMFTDSERGTDRSLLTHVLNMFQWQGSVFFLIQTNLHQTNCM